jgi:hypothetical protein
VAVRGVARQEDPAPPVFGRQHVVDLPQRHVLDLHRDIGVPDGLVHPREHRLLADVDLFRGRVVHEQQHELAPRPHRDKNPGAEPEVLARLAGPEQHPGAVGAVAGQVGLQPDVDRIAETGLALEREPALLGDGRAAAVSADGVASPDPGGLAGVAGADGGGDAVRVLLDVDQFGREPDVGTLVERSREDPRLEQVLRRVAHLAGARCLVVRLAIDLVAPGPQPRDLPAREAGGPDVVGHQCSRDGDAGDVVLDAEITKHLHRALVGDVRARGVRGARVLGHGHGIDALTGEQR